MLSVTPLVSMFDTPVTITAQKLRPGQKVTISAQVEHVSGKFESFAHLTADDHGCIDLARDSSEGGTYEGVHPMGLFISLQQSPNQRSGLRLMPRKVDQPMQYRFSLINGHGFHDSVAIIDSVLIDRLFLHPAVDRREIEVGRIRGTLFMPKSRGRVSVDIDGIERDRFISAGSQKIPGIIDIFGAGGGLMEHRGALLSSKGFAVLSLAYFGFKDLPNTLDQVDLNYFEEAIDWLSSQPEVTDRIGFIGNSTGSAIAVLCGMRFPKLKAVVGINGFHSLLVDTPFPWNGIPQPTVAGNDDDLRYTDAGREHSSFFEKIDVPEESVFHIETCPPDTKWLLTGCTDDRDICSVKSARLLEKRLISAGKGNQIRVLILKDAGHLLEPPFMPHCLYSFIKYFDQNLAWGGDKYAHAEGQDAMWRSVIDFFATNIAIPHKLPDLDKLPSFKSSL